MYIAKPHQQQLLSHILDDDSTSSETDHLSPDAKAAEVRIIIHMYKG